MITALLLLGMTACGAQPQQGEIANETSVPPAQSSQAERENVKVSDVSAKQPTEQTVAANEEVYALLDFSDEREKECAQKGPLAAPDALEIKDENGKIVWSQTAYAFLEGDAPDTANPSLWRNAQLNHIYGLFEVTDGVYQVRGVITYNYKGKRKTLKLKDIKDGSDLKESAPPQQENPNPLPIGGGIGFLLLFCLLIHRAPSPCISKNCISISILTILTGNIYRNISSGALKKSSKVQEYISCNPTSRLTGIFNSQVSIREYTFLLISIPMRFNFATS